MRTLFPRALAALALALPLAAAAQKKPSDVPVEDFFRRAQYSEMSLSPDGGKLAALTPLKGRDNLVIVDLDKRTRNIITSFEKLDVAGVYWVSSKRLCMRVIDGHVVSGNPVFKGTYCIDASGEDLRNFSDVGQTARRGGLVPVSSMLEESDDYIMGMRQRSARSIDLYRFNTRTGRFTLLTNESPGDVVKWVLDRNLVPRVAVSYPEREPTASKGTARVASVWHRAGEGAKWEKLWEFRTGWFDDDQYDPVAFDFDNETLYVATNKGRDKEAIHAFDTKTRTLAGVLVEHPLIDVSGGLIFSRTRKKLVGVRLNADKPVQVWTDPHFAAIQKGIDGALKGTFNLISFGVNNDRRALIRAFSDVDPGSYYLYDLDKKTLEPVAKQREWIDPSLMAERKFITYKARDGMEIPAYVTIPKGGGKNLPLIVNIHGGPWLRAYTWASWDRWPEAQFFASRGYVVLEPEPRASTGWGRKHYYAGLKQWGLTMQDDITDGALHLVKEGLVDRNRMCLHGASYGGYATLQGLVKEPDLWKCGNAFLAVTDLVNWQSMTYTDTSQQSDFMQHDFNFLIGDSSAERAKMEAASPARNAARIKAPILLTMGSDDVRVPQSHGDTMKAALESAGRKFDYHVYIGEGHGYNKDEHVFDFYRRSERFFAEHLKK